MIWTRSSTLYLWIVSGIKHGNPLLPIVIVSDRVATKQLYLVHISIFLIHVISGLSILFSEARVYQENFFKSIQIFAHYFNFIFKFFAHLYLLLRNHSNSLIIAYRRKIPSSKSNCHLFNLEDEETLKKSSNSRLSYFTWELVTI